VTTAIKSKLHNHRVLVIGDLMIDHSFVARRALRLDKHHTHANPLEDIYETSKEDEESILPGGAARIAALLENFGAIVSCTGVIGNDERAVLLHHLLKPYTNIEDKAVVERGRPTTLKLRLYEKGQGKSPAGLKSRIDRETTREIAAQTEDQLITVIREEIPKTHAIVIADYDKGVMTSRVLAQIASLAQQQDKPIILSPKSVWRKYGMMPIAAVTARWSDFLRGVVEVDTDDIPSV
jgi:D-beta-D-heptose 7-phosphate kinase/D-beta-D-heptose 1-phosphate adenosyltransferase